jgi:hypothetical protein
VCLGVTRTRGGIWWSGEAVVESHALPLLYMKIAKVENELTTSHVLVSRLTRAAALNRSSSPAHAKFLRGTLVSSIGKPFARGIEVAALVDDGVTTLYVDIKCVMLFDDIIKEQGQRTLVVSPDVQLKKGVKPSAHQNPASTSGSSSSSASDEDDAEDL